ncbi:multicopper oxidase domain-containing protein [Dehalogenimonas sp. THU2]|uniref:multicopper oxidase family protein n=1 Tax=Dehalogenimonas sp. THU2 TaxID=3151121 RepID=UPI0032186CE3
MRRAGITAAGAGGLLLAESTLMRGVALFAAKPQPAGQVQLKSNKIPQFVDPLPRLSIAGGTMETVLADTGEVVLNQHTFRANIMPSTFVPANGQPYDGTWTFGYRVGPTGAPGAAVDTNVGPVIVAKRGVPTQVRYVNNLYADANTIAWHDWTDQTLHSAFHQAFNMGMPIGADANTHYMGPVLTVPHLHGGEVPALIDGGPEQWFASDIPGTLPITMNHGPAYYTHPGVAAAANECVFRYPNTQEAAPLWFHDHLLGGTRLNATFGGLAGAYALIDTGLALPNGLTPVGLDTTGLGNTVSDTDNFLIPLVIQDRMFDTNGQLFFPTVGVNPEHPFWVPEFVGDTIIVNGKVWPYLEVEPRRYRFYIVNGSNSRMYDMYLQDSASGIKGPRMWVIATDGGYLDVPVEINPNATGQQVMAGLAKSLPIKPGERYEVIIDFAGVAPGTNLILRNTAPTVEGNPKASTTGRIMQFRVVAPAGAAADNSYDPASAIPLRPPMVRLANPATGTLNVIPSKTRFMTLNEIVGAGGPLEALVNNSKWGGHRMDMTPIPGSTPVGPAPFTNYLTELPVEGDTEVWEIANLTMDSHPIHLHAIQFQLINRQPFDMAAFMAAYDMSFPGGMFMPGYGPPLPYDGSDPASGVDINGNWILGGNPDVAPYLLGVPLPPLAHEAGWKDTVIMNPGEVTRIVTRWAPQDIPAGGVGAFDFTPNEGNGVYVWHCHITDHEDNEMMRPDWIESDPATLRSYIQGTDY